MVFGRFAGGFRENGWFWCGFLMVNLWWMRGETWCVDITLLALKNFLIFQIYFSDFPFWEIADSDSGLHTSSY